MHHDITYNMKISLQAICLNMPDLSHLNLSNNQGITDAGTLGLNLEDSLPPNSVLELKDSQRRHRKIPLGLKQEKELHLAGLRREILAESLVESGQSSSGLFRLDKLVSLNLSHTSVTNLTLKLAIDSPDLRSLNVGGSAAVEDDGLYEFAIRHPCLEKLELGSTGLTDTALISGLSCLPRLAYLDLSSCQQVTNAGLPRTMYIHVRTGAQLGNFEWWAHVYL